MIWLRLTRLKGIIIGVRGEFGRLGCEGGGIGRRTRFRFWRRKVWGFESPLSHQNSQNV